MKKILLIMVLAGLGTSLSAQGYFNIYGQVSQYQTARSLGLGGSGLASETGARALFLNPALVAKDDSPLSFWIGSSMSRGEEERSIRVYDSFENYLADEIYAMQKYSTANVAFAGAWRIGSRENVSSYLGLGFNRYLDFYYQYEEQLRNPDPFNVAERDLLYGYNRLDSDGAIYQVPLTLAIGDKETNFYLAMTMNALFGEIDQKKFVKAVSANDPPFADSTIYDQHYETDGITFAPVLSFAHQADTYFTYAVRVDFPFSIKFKDGYEYGMPLRVGFGFDYRARNILWARLSADFEYAVWEKVRHNWSFGYEGDITGDANWHNTWNIKLGVEHLFHETYPLRVGFNYKQIPQIEKQTAYLVTLGTGFMAGAFEIELSGGIGSRTWRHADIFPNSLNGAPNRLGEDALDKVKDIYTELMVTATYRF